MNEEFWCDVNGLFGQQPAGPFCGPNHGGQMLRPPSISHPFWTLLCPPPFPSFPFTLAKAFSCPKYPHPPQFFPFPHHSSSHPFGPILPFSLSYVLLLPPSPLFICCHWPHFIWPRPQAIGYSRQLKE
jgi:hypothetical protein